MIIEYMDDYVVAIEKLVHATLLFGASAPPSHDNRYAMDYYITSERLFLGCLFI